MSDLSSLCAQERRSQKGETLSPSHRSRARQIQVSREEAFYRCTFLLFTPVERVEVFCELRTSEKLINVRFHGQLGLPSWYRPLADSYQLTLDASTITLVLIPTRS